MPEAQQKTGLQADDATVVSMTGVNKWFGHFLLALGIILGGLFLSQIKINRTMVRQNS